MKTKKGWKIVTGLLFALLLIACEEVDVKKVFEVQGEVIGLELIHGEKGVLINTLDRTVLGLKIDGNLQRLEIKALHPELQVGKSYKIRYSKWTNQSMLTYLFVGDSCKLESVEMK